MQTFFLIFFLMLGALNSFGEQTRKFTFYYAFTVRGIEPRQKIEIWFPAAHTDAFQSVRIVAVTGYLPLTKDKETKFGNTLFHALTPETIKGEYTFNVEYEVLRQEHIGLPRPGAEPHFIKASAKEVNEFLRPDKLVPISGKLAAIAAKQVQGQSGTIERAHALYNYVVSTMRYDKSGSGWGRGDAEWACDSKRGNCTDFHSAFISMASSQGIPARFEIGYPLPSNKTHGEVPGYHC